MDVAILLDKGWTEQEVRVLPTFTLVDLFVSVEETGFESRATNAPDDPEAILLINELQRIANIIDDELVQRNSLLCE